MRRDASVSVWLSLGDNGWLITSDFHFLVINQSSSLSCLQWSSENVWGKTHILYYTTNIYYSNIYSYCHEYCYNKNTLQSHYFCRYKCTIDGWYLWYKYSMCLWDCMFIPDFGCYVPLHLCTALSLCSQSSKHIFIYLRQYENFLAFLCSQNELKCGEWACFGALTGGSYFDVVWSWN